MATCFRGSAASTHVGVIESIVSISLQFNGGTWGGKVLRRDATVACHLPSGINALVAKGAT